MSYKTTPPWIHPLLEFGIHTYLDVATSHPFTLVDRAHILTTESIYSIPNNLIEDFKNLVSGVTRNKLARRPLPLQGEMSYDTWSSNLSQIPVSSSTSCSSSDSSIHPYVHPSRPHASLTHYMAIAQVNSIRIVPWAGNNNTKELCMPKSTTPTRLLRIAVPPCRDHRATTW